MSDKIIQILVTGCVLGATALWNNVLKNKLKNYFFPFEFKDKDKIIIFKFLVLKFNDIIKDLDELSTKLIENNIDFLNKLVDKIKTLKKYKDLEKILSEKKKIIILGNTGVGKSTLINCIEKKIIAKEAIISAPTTMKYIKYESNYNNLEFCDTRGLEKSNLSEIEEKNIKDILEDLKQQNSFLFWYVKLSSSTLEETDIKYIKKIKDKLNKKITYFFVITKSDDDEVDKKKLEESLKHYFPEELNIPIFPVYARGTKKIASYGLDELMNESVNFFKKNAIEKIFEKIYIKDEFNEKSSIIDLFNLYLKQIRLEDNNSNSLDNIDNNLINDFINNKYENFVNKNIEKIKKLCCLIKAKNDVVDINDEKGINQRLININNSSQENIENNLKEEILEGCSEFEKEKITSKQVEYLSDEYMENQLKIVLKSFVVNMFKDQMMNQIKNYLLNENIF